MKYNPALDGLRAVAVLAVVAFHALTPGFPGGYIGVDVFFVLSGYLITGLLLGEQDRTGRVRLGRFYRRRALRLLPALTAMLMAYVIVSPWLWPHRPLAEHVLDAGLTALYLSDYSYAYWGLPDALRHTWSLSVEAHFYALWPIALLYLLRPAEPRRLAWQCLGLWLAVNAWRLIRVMETGDWQVVYYSFDSRLSGLLCGAALAALIRAYGTPGRAPAALLGWTGAVAAVAAVGILRWEGPHFLGAGVPLVDIAAAGVIAALVTGTGHLQRLLSGAVIAYAGRISYGIYLWHYPIVFFLRDHLPWWQTLAIGGAASVACAAASYHTIEAWAGRYRGRHAVGVPAVPTVRHDPRWPASSPTPLDDPRR